MKPLLQHEDFVSAAQKLGCEVAVIKAVCEVEAPKGGFDPEWDPTTLFEGHHFHRFTHGRFSTRYPSISYPRWDRTKYGKDWAEEKRRLRLAASLEPVSAFKSASWGKFQIMGFNHLGAGHRTIQKFVEAMSAGEPEQLMAFVSLIEYWKIAYMLVNKDFASFAERYNGPSYRRNRYDEKMASAYLKYSKEA